MKKSFLKKMMNQKVPPVIRHLTLLPRSAQKTASLKCPRCGGIGIKFVNTQVGHWCARCGYQGVIVKPNELRDEFLPACKLDNNEMVGDQAVIDRVLTWKKK